MIAYGFVLLSGVLLMVRIAQQLTSESYVLNILIWSVVVGVFIYIVHMLKIPSVLDVVEADILSKGYLIAFGVAVICLIIFVFQAIFTNR